MGIILPPIPDVQMLMDYVIKNYRRLEDFCKLDSVEADIKKCVECHRKSYRPGGIPKYQCQNFRKVYLMRYLATHMTQLEAPLLMPIREIAKQQAVVKVASLGGGPGAEAITLMDLIKREGSPDSKYMVIFDNFDSEMSWKPIYNNLTKEFSSYLKNISIQPHFHKWDFGKKSWVVPDEESYQIVFVSWLLSEVNDEGKRLEVLKQALRTICENGYVIVAERTEQSLTTIVSKVLRDISGAIKVIDEKGNHAGNCGLDLNQIWDDFEPQAKYQTAYWVLRKA